MFCIVLTCVLALSKMFPTMFKPREIPNFIQGKETFHLGRLLIVSYLLYHWFDPSLLQLLGT